MNIYIHRQVENFIKDLSNPAKAKTLRTIDLLEKFGIKLRMPHSKKIKGDIFELRVRGESEVRIFYTFNKKSAVLLHGIIKKSRETPRRDIEIAIARVKDLD